MYKAQSTKYKGEPPVRLYFSMALLSCGLIGYEVGLMRVLLYASWHHFAFLIISIALLGFGMSGTILTLFRCWFLRRGDTAIPVLIALTAFTMLGAVQIAQYLPVSARITSGMITTQIGYWIVYWVLLTIPFTLGASAIGLMLMISQDLLPKVYAVNLLGSAAGAIVVTLSMYILPPAWLSVAMGGITLLGCLRFDRIQLTLGLIGTVGLTALVWVILDPPFIHIDDQKYQAYVDRLVTDGQAGLLATEYSPRGVMQVFQSDTFHNMPFLTGQSAPPGMNALVMDGHWAGSLLRIDHPDKAGVLDETLMAFPYALVAQNPRVLLLDERGGGNIWLAVRNKAQAVHIVQPNRSLLDLLAGPMRHEGGIVFDLPQVIRHQATPRQYIETDTTTFDLIQLAGMESWGAATGGLEGLNEDHLMTVEGMWACISKLKTDGILHVSRGIQLPPRDNVKLLATLIEALKRKGIAHPERHIAVVRDFLGVCTMVRPRPWTSDEIRWLRELYATRNLTPVYFTGIRPEELNQPDTLPGPADEQGDWLYHALLRLFSDDVEGFLDAWPFDVTPATDDRPFFGNFGKLSALPDFQAAYGDQWLSRTEMALLFVLAALGMIAIAGVTLTVIPVLCLGEVRRASGRMTTAGYFFTIGLAYLMLEITFLSRIQRLVGDPVLAGAVTIAGFLLFSGLGSITATRIVARSWVTLPRLLILLTILVWPTYASIDWLAAWTGTWSLGSRLVMTVVLIGPIAFLMGIPFPVALRQIEHRTTVLVPWAWGVNGFASVLASPAAIALAMQWGFNTTLLSAIGCYLLASLVAGKQMHRESN